MHGQSAPVQGQAGPSWQDGPDVWILSPTVVRFLGRVQSGESNSLVTMAALCYFIIAQGEQTLILLSIMGGGDGSIVLRRQSWRHRTQLRLGLPQRRRHHRAGKRRAYAYEGDYQLVKNPCRPQSTWARSPSWQRIHLPAQVTLPVPQRFDAGDDRAASIQLRLTRLSPKNYGTTNWNRYAYQQAAIL
jgi:hypothetical protein